MALFAAGPMLAIRRRRCRKSGRKSGKSGTVTYFRAKKPATATPTARPSCRSTDVHLADFSECIDVARVGEPLNLVHPLDGRRLEARLGRIEIRDHRVHH